MNKNKNIFLVLICILFLFYCKGQKTILTFSPSITSSKDTSVKAIAHLWKNYLDEVHKDYMNSWINPQYNRQSAAIQSVYWHHNQSEDLLISEIEKTMLFGEFSTFRIRKSTETIYEIHTLVQAKAQENNEIDTLYIYKVCAEKTDKGFKLLNYFDVYKNVLQNYTSENIEFYYPYEFHFDTEKVKETEKFIRQFSKDYHIEKMDKKIIYVIGNNLRESNAFLGFDFSIANSENKFAGYFIEPRTILTTRQDHIHELVHVLIKSTYPFINDILNEGMSTYYGGTAGLDYHFLRNNLRKYLDNNSIDFSNLSSLRDTKIDADVNLAYIVGAIIIDYTLKNYGTYKVIELFSCQEYEDIFAKLEIKKDNVNDFINQLVTEKILHTDDTD